MWLNETTEVVRDIKLHQPNTETHLLVNPSLQLCVYNCTLEHYSNSDVPTFIVCVSSIEQYQ